jgi:hypothetical protein
MLCAKCHQKEATVHFTAVMDGMQEEAVQLCKDCSPTMGLDLDKQIQALSVVGRKCEFCGTDASSGEMRARGGAIYWCEDCGLERSRILVDLLASEQPDLVQRSKESFSFLAFCSDPGLQAWSASASEKATQTLKDRRRQDGRDKDS